MSTSCWTMGQETNTMEAQNIFHSWRAKEVTQVEGQNNVEEVRLNACIIREGMIREMRRVGSNCTAHTAYPKLSIHFGSTNDVTCVETRFCTMLDTREKLGGRTMWLNQLMTGDNLKFPYMEAIHKLHQQDDVRRSENEVHNNTGLGKS